MPNHQAFTWDNFAITDVGRVRTLNEDACLARPEVGLWLVADGMGGHSSGDLASQMVVSTFQQLPFPDSLADSVDMLEEGLLEINRTLKTEADERGGNITIGCTVVGLMAYQRELVVFWAGDSRAYMLRNGRLKPITRDHTQVEELVEQGFLLREDADNHPSSNVVTRAVGAMDYLFVEFGNQTIEEGDTYLLCSDGLTKEMQNGEIEQVLSQAGSAEEACRQLLDITLERGSRDNVTIIVIRALPLTET
jgi:serine/threonine protein phosphatase PrpC